MATETSVVVTIDSQGRLTVPVEAREALNIDGRRAKLELHIEKRSAGDEDGI